MRILLPALGVGLIALSACVSVLPEPEAPDALYRMSASRQAAPLSATVLIREPEAPQIMSGRAMVREDESGAIRLIPNNEWAGRATRLFQLALVDSFSSGTGAAVLPESGVAADYEFAIRITTLGFVGDEAACEASGSLISAKTRTLVSQERIRIARPALEGRPQTLKIVSEQCVTAFSQFLTATLNTRETLDETAISSQ
ncbi:MAG: ABC-type transport auxiliary lipoprotein family protein [Pseudomonadota bacterium]